MLCTLVQRLRVCEAGSAGNKYASEWVMLSFSTSVFCSCVHLTERSNTSEPTISRVHSFSLLSEIAAYPMLRHPIVVVLPLLAVVHAASYARVESFAGTSFLWAHPLPSLLFLYGANGQD